jgi:hypothetical protein
MANFFNTALGRAVTGVAGRVVGGLGGGAIGEGLVTGAADYVGQKAAEKKAKSQAKSLPKSNLVAPLVASTALAKRVNPNSVVAAFPQVEAVRQANQQYGTAAVVRATKAKAASGLLPFGGGMTAGGGATASFSQGGGHQVATEAQVQLMRRLKGGGYTNRELTMIGLGGQTAIRGGHRYFGPNAVTWVESPRRRLNPCNIRALRRAARRMEGFMKIARRFLVLERKLKFKKRRKR